MKNQALLGIIILMATMTASCGTGSDGSGNESEEYYGDYYGNSSESSGKRALSFGSSRDVYNYINGKTFSGDGLKIRFYNNGHSVDVNGTNTSNNIRIYDIGKNENNVAYATVQVINPAGVTTTFALLAVDGKAQLIDPNDGAVYEY